VLRDLGFTPSMAEEDIWMKDMGDHYEYITVYVDNLLIASKNPKSTIVALESNPINFKLKGSGPLSFHLGCDYFREEDGTMCYGPKKYITRMVDAYMCMFSSQPSTKHHSPWSRTTTLNSTPVSYWMRMELSSTSHGLAFCHGRLP
jgi:hypothetical protein